MVAAENRTDLPILATERDVNSKYWKAMPVVPKPPKKFEVIQGYHSGDDMVGWRDAVQAD